jgi:hypothetical protein
MSVRRRAAVAASYADAAMIRKNITGTWVAGMGTR